jgi:hypothetical protein
MDHLDSASPGQRSSIPETWPSGLPDGRSVQTARFRPARGRLKTHVVRGMCLRRPPARYFTWQPRAVWEADPVLGRSVMPPTRSSFCPCGDHCSWVAPRAALRVHVSRSRRSRQSGRYPGEMATDAGPNRRRTRRMWRRLDGRKRAGNRPGGPGRECRQPCASPAWRASPTARVP